MRRFLLLLLLPLGVLAMPGRALAHNSLDTSDPPDGATLSATPSQITFFFTADVPLDTLTITLVGASGVRTELSGSTHGASGVREVVTPLPGLEPGPVSVRWRLVGPDGHPVTDTVDFTITAPVAATVPATTPAAEPTATVPLTTTPPPPTESVDTSDGSWSTPGFVRWLIRAVAYLAILVAAGTVLTQTLVQRLPGRAAFARWLGPALLVVAVTAFLQLLIVASDVSGAPLWEAAGDIYRALSTTAGMAFFVRIGVALGAWVLLDYAPPRTEEVRNATLVLLTVALLGTWAFAGHSRTMRWPALGVPVDVVHHGAAAAWLGGLAIIGLLVLPRANPEQVMPLMRRFSTMAGLAVGLIVGTGLFQAVRLVGSPGDLFSGTHGKLLVAKIVVLGAMLYLANQNRERVLLEQRNVGAAVRPDIGGLQRVMAMELLIGLVIIGLTAALVVSAPATSGVG